MGIDRDFDRLREGDEPITVGDLWLEDYRQAPSGKGPLAGQWADKPHRLLYDLIAEIERLRK